MSPTVRMRVLVSLAAVVAAAAVAGVVYATRQDPAQPHTICKRPSPLLASGVRSPHISQVRAAFSGSAKDAARALEALADRYPHDPVVQYNDGAALECAGYLTEAAVAFRRAKQAGRDTEYEVRADNFLHLQFFGPGYPPFEYGGKDPLLIQGQFEQSRFHQRTAERLYARAARLHPDDPEAQVAAAVGRFDMDDLSASFSRLGPLVKRFPRSQSVRFHLGLLLSWTGQRVLAEREFRAARALGPATRLGRESDAFLRGLAHSGSGRTKR
jgi:tetratricopeptide (TPR) repeat protein